MNDYTPAEQGEIRADIESMHRSGRIELPQRAERLAAIAERMTGVIETANSRSAQMGDHPVLIYNELTNTLQDHYLTPFGSAMQRLQSERSQPIHAAQNGINPWFLPTLDGVANEPWQHEAET